MSAPRTQLSRSALGVGSMIGAGIFTLPTTCARPTGDVGAIVARCIVAGGMLIKAAPGAVLPASRQRHHAGRDCGRRRHDMGWAFPHPARCRAGDGANTIATLCVTAMLYADGAKFLLLAALPHASGTWTRFYARREQQQRVFTHAEWPVCSILAVATIAALIALLIGEPAI